MPQIIVDAFELRQTADRLNDLSLLLGGMPSTADTYADSVGGHLLENDILDFNHQWKYGIGIVSHEIGDMVQRLQEAAEAYERSDRYVGEGASGGPPGAPPTPRHHLPGHHGSGGGSHHGGGSDHHHHHHHHHHHGGGSGTGTGTGTTTIGGGTKHGGSGGHGSHAPIAVHSKLLTSDQRTFVAKLSTLTGLNPRVCAAWCLAEESSGYAKERQAQDNNNWLNIGYFDSGRGGISYGDAWKNPTTAAEQTAKFLKGEWGGADPSIQDILHAAGKSPEAQLEAIYQSKWASSHYDGGTGTRGASLHDTYKALAGMTVTDA